MYQIIGEFHKIIKNIFKKAKLVVGVEIVPEAIEDAKLNSALNGNRTKEKYII